MRDKRQLVIEIAGDVLVISDLEAALPKEILEALRAQGAAGVDVETPVKDAEARILGLAEAHFGEEAGKAFAKVVASGITVEMFTATKEAMGGGPAAEGDGGTAVEKAKANLEKAKAEMLAAIQQAGPDNPGSGGGADGSDKDFLTLVAEYRAANKCTKSDAMLAVQAANPKAHEAYLQKYN